MRVTKRYLLFKRPTENTCIFFKKTQLVRFEFGINGFFMVGLNVSIVMVVKLRKMISKY